MDRSSLKKCQQEPFMRGWPYKNIVPWGGLLLNLALIVQPVVSAGLTEIFITPFSGRVAVVVGNGIAGRSHIQIISEIVSWSEKLDKNIIQNVSNGIIRLKVNNTNTCQCLKFKNILGEGGGSGRKLQ